MTPPAAVPLVAYTDVAGLARSAVETASTAAARLARAETMAVDPQRVAVAYSSERWFRIDGQAPSAFAPLSGFFTTLDGWVRTHANYPHHAQALRRMLGLSDNAGAADAATVLATRHADEVSAAIRSAGGLCVAVRPEDLTVDAQLRQTPLVRTTRLGDAPPRPLPDPGLDAPLRGVRVLDLTRVMAGPVGTRVLALLGADVLRIDPPHSPEIAWQHLDTGHGNRTALLDLRAETGRRRFEELLDTADLIWLGYRPTGLARLGLTPAALARRRPGLIVLRHQAWPDPDRRGFDSLVQAECGIAVIERAADRPGALPAQALDHSTGYLLAAAALTLLHARSTQGGSWLAETSLRRVAAELLGRRRADRPHSAKEIDPTGHTQRFRVSGLDIVTSAPALAYAGGPTRYAPPRPWGQDEPRWR